MSDELLERIASGTGTAQDLRGYADAAQRDPDRTSWEMLAAALRAEFLLARGTRAAVACAERVAPPMIRAANVSRRRHLAGMSGWLAATVALALLGWMVAQDSARSPDTSMNVHNAALVSADDALDRYLEAGIATGRVLRELPPQTVEVRTAADGVAAEVIFVRRVLERTEVDTAYRLAADEYGDTAFVPAQRAAPPRRESM